MSVANLTEIRRAPLPEVVADLEILLEQARSGELRAFACVAASSDNTVLNCYQPGDATIASMYLAVAHLQQQILDTSREGAP